MTRKLDYRWNLRQVMASRGMFQTTDLIGPLAQRGIKLSSSQVYRLVDRAARAAEPEGADGAAGHPGLLDGGPDRTGRRGHGHPEGKRSAAAGKQGIGELRPKRARITPAGG